LKEKQRYERFIRAAAATTATAAEAKQEIPLF
jgi:hypothetical protein